VIQSTVSRVELRVYISLSSFLPSQILYYTILFTITECEIAFVIIEEKQMKHRKPLEEDNSKDLKVVVDVERSLLDSWRKL